MQDYLVTVKIIHGELEEGDQVIVKANSSAEAELLAYEDVKRGDLDPSDSGYFDLGGEIHLQVTGVQVIDPAHLPILLHYLHQQPLSQAA